MTDQPHSSVSDNSLYKYIDIDLPDSERIRQLLIWSSLRSATTSTPSTPNPPSSSSRQPLPPLPPLSAPALQVLKNVQEDIVKTLVEKRLDLSHYDPEASSSQTKQKDLLENEQNVRNRKWEVIYSDYIKESVCFAIHELHSQNFYHLFIINIVPTRKMKLGKKSALDTKPWERNYRPP